MNFREKLLNFMAGRYGFDELGKFLFSVGFGSWALCFILRFICRLIWILYYPYMILSAVNTIVYLIAIFRILSRNIERRRRENEKFLDLRDRLRFTKDKGDTQYKSSSNDGYRDVKYRPVDSDSKKKYKKVKVEKPKKDKEHIFRKCPQCGTNLRLKKLRGKHNTVCPKCGNSFSVRVWF